MMRKSTERATATGRLKITKRIKKGKYMFKINKHRSDNEVILYKSVKQKKFSIVFLFFVALLMIFIALVPCFKNMFLGKIDFNSVFAYKYSIYILMSIIPIFIMMTVDHIFNCIVITDKNILIRKGISGKLYIIDFNDISAYQHEARTYKKITSNYIYIHMKSGKRISTGSLNVKSDNLTSLIEILNCKIEKVIKSQNVYNAQCKQKNYSVCNSEVRRNLVLPIICVAPFIIGLTMSALYFGGINKMGEQLNIEVHGIVTSKSYNKNTRGGTTTYDFTINETGQNKEYRVPVSYDIYTRFQNNDSITIIAKKGILGIVYDELIRNY